MKVSLPKPHQAFFSLPVIRYVTSWAPVAVGWFLWVGSPVLAAFLMYLLLKAAAG